MLTEPVASRAKRRRKVKAGDADVVSGALVHGVARDRRLRAKGGAVAKAAPPEDAFVRMSKRWASPSLESVTAIERGLTFDALADIDTQLPDTLRRIIPRSTLAAQKKKGETLTPAQGERLYQAGKVFGFATTVLGDTDAARRFLTRPHPMLDDRTPLDIALESGAGADLVVNLLGRGAYGGGA